MISRPFCGARRRALEALGPTALLLAAVALAACSAPGGEATPDASSTVASGEVGDGWRRAGSAPLSPPEEALAVGFLIVDGVYNSELMAPYDIFHHTPFHTAPNPGMEVFTVSPDGASITTFEGLVIAPHHSFGSAPPIDILVVPSAEHSMDSDLENTEMIDWVRRVGGEADYVVSLCDGAFVLAAAGLLDQVACTTFPGDLDAFERRFPDLDVRRDVSFVHDGGRLTSAGGAKSYDVAMHLVDHVYGERVARGVAGGLIIDWPPGDGELAATIVDRPIDGPED